MPQSAEQPLGDTLDRRRVHEAFRLGLQKQMGYASELDKRLADYRLEKGAAADARADDLKQARLLLEAGSPEQVRAAAQRLSKNHGVSMDGRFVSAMVEAAEHRQEVERRKLDLEQREVDNRDPANRVAAGPTFEQRLQLSKMRQDGYDTSDVAGAIGGGAPGSLPPAEGPMVPTTGAGQPVQNAPGLANRFALRGPALTAKGDLDGVRASHQLLLSQAPFPGVATQKDAEASLSLGQRKAWQAWNAQVQASARSLASARAKYLNALPRFQRQQMGAMAEQVLSQIKSLSKGAEVTVNSDQFIEIQRKLRLQFENQYGVDLDAARKAANR